MDKDLLGKIKACKTAEEVKALLGSRIQLSEGEVEQVTGGASYKDLTPEGFMQTALALTNAYGFTVAQDMVKNYLGVADGYFRMRQLCNGNYEQYWYSMAVDLYSLGQ